MRYHFTPIRMAIIKRDIKCWQGCGEKGTLVHCWWDCKLVQPLWKTICRFLKKLKIELPYDPAIPILSIYPKELKARSQKRNQDRGVEGHALTPSCENTRITTSCWNSPKKISHTQRQRRSHNEMVGGVQSQ